MAVNPYDPCICGSGKKFKWCCQPLEETLEKAVEQFNSNQIETALRTMDTLVRDHPTNPQAFGQKAQMLMAAGRIEEAEKALDSAFAINPNYPFGLMMRGVIRQQEGEVKGAMILFRKAIDVYDPSAKPALHQLYSMIGEGEMIFNRPVAARFAYQRTIELEPIDQEGRQQFAAMFESGEARIPECARKEYKLRATKKSVEADPKVKLNGAIQAFEKLTQETADDATAWFNLGLCQAWIGDNPKAVESLNRSIELEKNDDLAAEAVTLVEVLRCGQGMEEQSDYVEHRVLYRMTNPDGLMQALRTWGATHRMIGARQNPQDGSISGLILEEGPVTLIAGNALAKLGAYIYVVGDLIRLWHPHKESVEKIAKELVIKTGMGVTELKWDLGGTQFADVVVDALRFPQGTPTEPAEMEQKWKSELSHFFEEVWVDRPMKALSNLTPTDVAKSPTLRKKVMGVIQFTEDCFNVAIPPREIEDDKGNVTHSESIYSFDGVRRKLGLIEGGVVVAPKTEVPKLDIAGMSAEQIAGLATESLTPSQLEDAFRIAMKHGVREHGDRFATAIVGSPANPATPDRFPFFNHLIMSAQNAGDADRVTQLLIDAASADREQNEGKRQGDYLLRRGQMYTKRGQFDEGVKAFDELAESEGVDAKHVGSAVESLLSAKRGSDALRLGEQGLVLARKKGSRDLEHYFLELIAAAKKQA